MFLNPQFDVDHGGRLEVRAAAMLIWSTPDRPQAEPIGTASFDWHTPAWDQVTLCTLGWGLAAGGAEDEVWQMLELLAGRPLRETPPC